MGWQLVSVYAYVPTSGGGGQPPGGGRPDPGFGVPGWPNQDLPRPGGGRPGYPPYVDIGFPGNQPYPDQSLPGNQPYPDIGFPGNQPYPDQSLPGFQPYPDIGFPGNQPYPDQSLPGYQPYPDQSLPGNQPIIWPGPRPPYVDIGFPGPQPGGPVYIDNTLPITPGIRPTPPIYNPGPPSFDPGNLPEHPELPDLNTGNWMWIQQPNSTESVFAFALWRGPIVTHPDYHPQYPPEEVQPGTWVVTAVSNRLTWAWIPTKTDSGDRPHPDRDRPDEQEKAAAKK